MFDIPQKFGVDGLVFSDNCETRMLIPFMMAAYDLGDINQSIRWAYEVIASYGYCPTALRQLILASIIKEDYRTAAKLLFMLKSVPFQKKWAYHHIALVENPDLIKNEYDIQRKRDLLPRKLYSDKDNIPHLTILKNLIFNEKNKAAFEYLMMCLLLEQKLDEFVSYLSFMEKFGYNRSPKHIQEALCMYVSVRKDMQKNILGRLVTQATWEQFQKFDNKINSYGSNLGNVKDVLQSGFGDSDWYYVHYVYPEMIAIKRQSEKPENDNPYIVKQQ